jgi:uncharacterized membrane protein YGL010W
MSLWQGRSTQSWVDEYEGGHRHPANRICHAIGIPMIVTSFLLLGLGTVVGGLWVWAAALFLAGWALQFVGHAFEGRPPEFLKNWRFLLVGTRWWWATVRARLRDL